MVFVFTFAVGGGSGTVVNMPNWALVCSPNAMTLVGTLTIPPRIRLVIPIIARGSLKFEATKYYGKAIVQYSQTDLNTL